MTLTGKNGCAAEAHHRSLRPVSRLMRCGLLAARFGVLVFAVSAPVAASAQELGIANIIRDLDIAVAPQIQGADKQWKAVANSSVMIEPKAVIVQQGQTIGSLLTDQNIHPDPRSEAIVRSLNPWIPADGTIQADQELNLLQVKGDLSIFGGKTIALMPYQTERRAMMSSFDTLSLKVDAIRNEPAAGQLVAAFDRTANTYRTTFWNDPELIKAIDDSLADVSVLVDEGRVSGFSSEWRSSQLPAAKGNLEVVEKQASNAQPATLSLQLKLMNGAPVQPQVSCSVLWGYAKPRNKVPLPLTYPIPVVVGDIYLEVRRSDNGAVVSEGEALKITAAQLIANPAFNQSVTTRESCG